MYLIAQGWTTNETYKRAAINSLELKVTTPHQQYPPLEQPDNTQKDESIGIVDDVCGYGKSADDKDSDRTHSDESGGCGDSLATFTDRKDAAFEHGNDFSGTHLGASQHVNSIQALRVDISIVGGEGGCDLEKEEQELEQMRELGSECRQRSDSTFDGAPSAVIELYRSSEKRKIGSSSSGSTSSSKRYCYCDVSDEEEDYILAEDSDEDEDLSYYENCCQSRSKVAASGTEENSAEGKSNATPAAVAVAIIETETPLEEDDLTAGCVPAFGASVDKTAFPALLSKLPDLSNSNPYKTDLLTAFRNVLIPPSTGKLRALHDRREAVAALGSDAAEMHND